MGESLRIRAVTGRTILGLKSWGFEQSDLIRIAGVDLPGNVGAVAARELRALCSGPADWLLVAPGLLSLPARDAIEDDSVRQGLVPVDLSSGLSVLEVSGPATREVLAKSCGLDFDPKQFPTGRCARTRFAQLSVVVDCLDATPRFDLYVGCSYGAYLRAWLDDAAVGFVPRPARPF